MQTLGERGGQTHHQLEGLPKATVQIFDYYSQDLKGWTTEKWNAFWTAWEGMQAAPVPAPAPGPSSAGAAAAAAAAAAAPAAADPVSSPMYQARPSWIVTEFKEVRFARNSGKSQVVLPTQMVVWGNDKDICTKGEYTRLKADIFTRVLQDLTATESGADAASATEPTMAQIQAAAGMAAPPRRAKAGKKKPASATQPAAAVRPAAAARKRKAAKPVSESEESSESAESSDATEESHHTSASEPEDEEEHVVEHIVELVTEGGVKWFLIKWEGKEVDRSNRSPCWMQYTALKESCPDMVAEFEQQQAASTSGARQSRKRAKRK